MFECEDFMVWFGGCIQSAVLTGIKQLYYPFRKFSEFYQIVNVVCVANCYLLPKLVIGGVAFENASKQEPILQKGEQ